MKRLSFLTVAVCLLFAVSAFAAGKEIYQARDYEWAKDPRSRALSTKGIEEFLPNQEPAHRMTTGFGDLLDSWTWSQIGIPAGYYGAGISIDPDADYLYLNNQGYFRIYVCDISTGTPQSPLWVPAPGDYPWGAGMDNDPNFWCGAWPYYYTGDWSYEYTTYPPHPALTGNRFFSYQGLYWMADMSDNFPADSLFQLKVGSGSGTTNNIFTFHEPSGTVGRNFGHSTWNYVSQRGLAYNTDNGTFLLGSWNSGRIWEVSYVDGSPIPGRDFAPTNYAVAGLAYEEVADGGPILWVQANSYDDLLQIYDCPVLVADDIELQMITNPTFPFIDPLPFKVKAKIANVGIAGQDFTTWCTIEYGTTTWYSDTISAYLAAFTSDEYEYSEFPNGQSIGTIFDICVYMNNPGDMNPGNDGPICGEFKILRECTQYVTDDYDMYNAFYLGGNYYTLAKEMRTTNTKPAALVWAGVNTVSKGEPYYPWPDPVYDPIEISAWVDDDVNGTPNTAAPAWAETLRPTDAPWVTVEVPECAFLGQGGGVWVGFRFINATGREGIFVDNYPRDYYDTWYRYQFSQAWYRYSGYGDWHIRGCLEYPPLLAITGLEGATYHPPEPWIREEFCKVDFRMKACGHVEGHFSVSNLLHELLPIMIPASNIHFIPPSFVMEGGESADASMLIVIPVGQHEGVYNGEVYVNHLGGIEVIPFSLTVAIDPDLDIKDNGGNVTANVMNLMGVRGGTAMGVFNVVNPNSFATNFDQFDGPANCDLYRGTEDHTDLDFCAGGPDPKEPIPASMMEVNLVKTSLQSGEGTYGIVQIHIPDWAKHWNQQYDFGYCATVDVQYEDRLANPASDEFGIYLKVLKAHGQLVNGFWGEHEGAANVIYWSDLGIEDGYILYRDGEKIAEFVGEYEYADPIVNTAEYSLGVNIGGSEIMIGPITVGPARLPTVFSLSQNYPNPVGENTSIRYAVAEGANVSIGVYNSAGMLVKTLVNEYRTPGIYTVNLDNVDLSNGVYFYRMNAGDFSMTRKMVVLK